MHFLKSLWPYTYRQQLKFQYKIPLCDDWLENPVHYDVPFQRSIEADYKRFLDPVASGEWKDPEKAITTSMTVVEATGIKDPDAIVGTGLGCLETLKNF